MTPLLRWLWREHEVELPGWIIALGVLWALDGAVHVAAQAARWLL